jgi:acetoin utilization deacetylase AcuC-like enzyme
MKCSVFVFEGFVMARTGLYYDDRMLLHDPGPGHPERAERLDAIRRGFLDAGVTFPNMPIVPATRRDLLRVHTPGHIDAVEEACWGDEPYPDPDTQMGADSWEAALLAAGASISACRAVLEGRIDNAFCAVRPPGHHAEEDQAMGFCLFNNIAVAGKWLLQEGGISRIAIVDWDVHHGNGTQQAFYNDQGAYFASMHQHPMFPGTGWPSERGAFNNILNIQMHPGAGGREWYEALGHYIIPELEKFKPEFVLVSAGFDAHRSDPLGSQRLNTDDFARMTRQVRRLAGGRLVSVLEGGYNTDALAQCALAHYAALQE